RDRRGCAARSRGRSAARRRAVRARPAEEVAALDRPRPLSARPRCDARRRPRHPEAPGELRAACRDRRAGRLSLVERRSRAGMAPGSRAVIALLLAAAAAHERYDAALAPRAAELLAEAVRFATVAGNDSAHAAQKEWLRRTAAALGLAARDAGMVI